MAYVQYFNALGTGAYIRAGDFTVYGTSGLFPDYNETYSLHDTDTMLVTGSFNNGAYWYGGYVDDIGHAYIFELQSAYLFDENLNDLIWMYDINVQFDIRDDFSNGASFYNMYSGADTFIGNRYGDYIEAGRGNDLVKGNAGNDLLKGQAGRDRLEGGTGADRLFGEAGRDVLKGGAGNDRLKGGGDVDRFVFKTGWDVDIIRDFDARGGVHDRLDLSGLKSVRGWNDLRNNHLERDGSDVVIDGRNGDAVILQGVNINDLDKGDFIF